MNASVHTAGAVGHQHPFEIVAIGTSLGGLAATSELLAHLPRYFPVPILLVQHLMRTRTSLLAPLLATKTSLRVRVAEARQRPSPGTVYVAPPNSHLRLTARRRLHLAADDKVHFTRPAVDPLFESIARVYGARAIAVVLTGMGRDGTLGARFVRERGGLVLAQDIASAKACGMPGTVILSGCAHMICAPVQLATALVALTSMAGVAEHFGFARVAGQESPPIPWAMRPVDHPRMIWSRN